MFAGCGNNGDANTNNPGNTGDNNQGDSAPDFSTMSIDELKPYIKTITDGKLTMVTSPDFAPYEFYALDEAGTPSLAGFDIALGKYIADFIGPPRHGFATALPL